MNTESVLSLFGKELPIHHEGNGEWLARLSFARAAFERDPSEENTLALGRALSSGQRVREALRVYSKGLLRNASSVSLYRYRGHRYISARHFDLAIADFERALQLTQWTATGSVSNELMFNIWYHLGLAHFLKGEFARAAAAYGECLQSCSTDEDVIACLDWYYMALRRDARDDEARQLLDRIDEHMDAGESRPYLLRLLAYKGERDFAEVMSVVDDDMEFATRSFGLANELLVMGKTEEAIRIFDRIVSGTAWMGFAHIAAEAELFRLRLV